MTKLRFSVFLTSIIVIASVAGQAAAGSLAGSEWGLGGGDDRFVKFGSSGKVSGHAGCNRFFSTYEHHGRMLKIAEIATTRKMCSEATMQLEAEWLSLLRLVRSLELTHLRLTLYGEKRVRLAELKRRDFD